ncbi:MAG: DUF885 domain-containing protein, partial [Planctomycetota bacterium]
QLDVVLSREEIEIRRELDRWLIDPLHGPQMRFLSAAGEQPARSIRQREQLLDRWRAFASSIHELELDARTKADIGYVAPRGSIERNVAQLDALLAIPTLDSPLLAPACGGGRWIPKSPDERLPDIAQRELGDALAQEALVALNPHLLDPEVRARGTWVLIPSATDPLAPEERGAFVAEVAAVIDDEIRPALESWRDALAFDLALKAPTDQQPGLLALPGGSGLYRDLVWMHTTTWTEPGAISDRALDELEALETELAEVASEALGVSDLDRVRTLLRGGAASSHPNAGAVEAALRSDLANVQDRLDDWFFDRSRNALVVTIEQRFDRDPAEAIAYLPPATDSSRPGRLVVDVGADREPVYATAAAAYGEGVPGRHYMRGLLRDRNDLPLFRRYASPTVIEEGWVDYAERLADEMELYAGSLERVGMLRRAVERRALAVADVGLHVEGWSRDDARDFLRRRTYLAPSEVELQIDLVLARPGAALAPVVGSVAIRGLRDAAERALGDDFDIRAFHEALTLDGPVDLRWLADRVGNWGDFDGRAAIAI